MASNSYNTKQRQNILNCLTLNDNRQMTAQEITDLLKSQGISVGKTTVYRYLEKLVETGEVRKFVSETDKSSTFQYIEQHDKCNEHMHLKCSQCGAFIHLSCEFMDQVGQHILEHHGFHVDNSKTVISGICDDCMKKREQSKD